MQEGTQRLLQHPRVVRRSPASAEDIERVANRFRAPLPEALVELWRISDGLSFGADPEQDGQLYGVGSVGRSLDQSLQLAPGVMPFVQDGQSNFLGLHVNPPLAPRISYLPHADGPSLFYRHLDSCLGDIARLFDTEMTLAEYLGSGAADYAHAAPRDDADDAVARQLLAGDEDQLVQAVCLLDIRSGDIWPRLLEGGYYARLSALERLKSASTAEAQALLAQDAESFQQFIEFTVRAAEHAGLAITKRSATSLRVGDRWLNLDLLYCRRNIPNAFELLSQSLADGAARKERQPGGYLG
jgi:hypothetical protein